jgi:hypothetical protein
MNNTALIFKSFLMKKLLILSMIIALLSACEKKTQDDFGIEATSNSLSTDGTKLVGQHYNLNIIGVQHEKTADMTGSNGHVIFVGLGEPVKGNAVTTRIYLFDSAESEDSDADFRVLDANGTDGEASFELPKPGYDAYVVEDQEDPVISAYSIYVRPLGKPGGWTTITTCADLVDGTGAALFAMLPNSDQKEIKNTIDDFTGAYCSVEQVGSDVTFRDKGKSSFVNVTAELTSIVFQIDLLDEFGNVFATYHVRVPIFDELIENEYWKYDNNGLKLLQVRFYPWGTDVTEADLLLL